MNCRRFRKHYLELLLPAGNETIAAQVQAHLDACPSCARFYDEMSRALGEIRPSHQVSASNQFQERIMNKIKEPVANRIFTMDTNKTKSREIGRGIFGGLFRRPTLAAIFAAALACTLLLFVISYHHTSNQVYALEQTLEANRSVQFIHMQFEPSGMGIKELWAQFGENGDLLRFRSDFPNTEDGPKIVSWEADKAVVWFQGKNTVGVLREKNFLEKTKMSIMDFDPRLMMEELEKSVNEGKLHAETQPSAGSDEPITLIVTNNASNNGRDIYKVDPVSKLVKEVEKYRLNDGNYELLGRIIYLDYNTPIGPEIFTLNPPADALRVDETTQVIGLAKGDLSDKEIAVKVVREFFEALIAKDYAKAGTLYSGIAAADVEKFFGHMKFTKIVSIDEPVPDEPTGSLRVPCQIELENGEEKTIFEPHGPFVRPVYSQPDRWAISGGI